MGDEDLQQHGAESSTSLDGRDIFLHYVSTTFGCVSNRDYLADQVLPKAA